MKMDVLINEAKLQARIKEMAKQIEKDYEGKESTGKIKINKDINTETYHILGI